MEKNFYREFLDELFQGHVFEKYNRIDKIETFLKGSLETGKTGLSGMARGVSLEKESRFESELKNIYRLLNHQEWDDFEIGKRLYQKVTKRMKEVTIAVDWTQVGRMMVLESCLILEGRGIPFYCKSVLKEDYKGISSTMEFSMEYALLSMSLSHQQLYVIADRGFAKLDSLGPSSSYPRLHRITRVKKTGFLNGMESVDSFKNGRCTKGSLCRLRMPS